MNGAEPKTTYQVVLNIFPGDLTCSSAPEVSISVATIQTNAAGNGAAYHVFIPADADGLHGATVGGIWTVSGEFRPTTRPGARPSSWTDNLEADESPVPVGVVAAELLAVRRRGIYECQRRGDALCRDVISLDCLIGRTPSGSYGLGALLLLNVDHQGAGHDAATGQRVGRVIEHAWHVASSRRVFRRIVSSAVGGPGGPDGARAYRRVRHHRLLL